MRGARTSGHRQPGGARHARAALGGLRRGAGGRARSGEPRVVSKPVEDVFLLTGELRAVRSESLVTPRGEGELQIRWLAEDGAEVKQGERLVEFDPTQPDPDDRGAAPAPAPGGDRRREPRATGERRDGEEARRRREGRARGGEGAPRRGRSRSSTAIRRTVRRSRRSGSRRRPPSRRRASSARPTRSPPRADLAAARATLEKARRELAAAELALGSMSLVAPRAGIFLVGNLWQWGPEGPRKLQPGRHRLAGLHGRAPSPIRRGWRCRRRSPGRPRPDRGRHDGALHPRHLSGPCLRGARRGDRLGRGGGRAQLRVDRAAGFPVRIALARTRSADAAGPLGARRGGARLLAEGALGPARRGPLRDEADRSSAVRAEARCRCGSRRARPSSASLESGLAEGDRVARFLSSVRLRAKLPTLLAAAARPSPLAVGSRRRGGARPARAAAVAARRRHAGHGHARRPRAERRGRRRAGRGPLDRDRRAAGRRDRVQDRLPGARGRRGQEGRQHPALRHRGRSTASSRRSAPSSRRPRRRWSRSRSSSG